MPQKILIYFLLLLNNFIISVYIINPKVNNWTEVLRKGSLEKWELSQQEKTWFKLLHYICWYRGTFEQSYPIISKWTICHILVAPQTSEKKHLNPIPGRGGINYLGPPKLKKWHFSKFKIFEKWHFLACNPSAQKP